jgi:hypothetical protein
MVTWQRPPWERDDRPDLLAVFTVALGVVAVIGIVAAIISAILT